MMITEASSGSAMTDEPKKLIAEGKYELVSTFDSTDGKKQYVYSFALSDGRSLGTNFSMRLENVSSWEDYQQKLDRQRQRRRERIDQAIAAGRFRLLDLEVMQIHICRDVLPDKKFKVQRIRHADGKGRIQPRSGLTRIESSRAMKSASTRPKPSNTKSSRRWQRSRKNALMPPVPRTGTPSLVSRRCPIAPDHCSTGGDPIESGTIDGRFFLREA